MTDWYRVRTRVALVLLLGVSACGHDKDGDGCRRGGHSSTMGMIGRGVGMAGNIAGGAVGGGVGRGLGMGMRGLSGLTGLDDGGHGGPGGGFGGGRGGGHDDGGSAEPCETGPRHPRVSGDGAREEIDPSQIRFSQGD